MSRTIAVSAFLACAIGGFVNAEESTDALRVEMEQRNSALVQQGYNLTNRLELGDGYAKREIEFLVPPSDRTHELRFWAHAVGGDVAFRATSTDNRLLASWEGQSGEISLALVLPPGRTRVEIDGSRAAAAFGVLGVKGLIVPDCQPPRVSMHSARVSAQFYWPYLLYMPTENRAPFLLVAPNNTGFSTGDSQVLAASGMCTVKDITGLADHLGTPVLVPLFPRPSVPGEEGNLYLHALTRASLVTGVKEYARVDLQLIAMVNDASSVLARQGVKLSHRVLLSGFSASGSFVSRFAMIHPDRVLAVASGSPGGWPIVPVAKDGDAVLPYPVGIADLQSLTGTIPDMGSLRRVAWFFFLGGDDKNDSVPCRDSFSCSDEALIFQRFGSTLQTRWTQAERLYREKGLNARFKPYPGVAHEVSSDMQKDIEAFLVAATRSEM